MDYVHAIMKGSSVIRNGIRCFHPAYFAMVMATGIVSIAFEAMAFPEIAKALFALNLVFYAVLCCFLLARMVCFWPALRADLRHPPRAQLFLTFVVGTNTIGMQYVIFHQAMQLAIFLWLVALIGWLVCSYCILSGFIAIREKSLHEIINGATLLIAVSTVSISLLGVRLLAAMGISDGHAYLVAGGFWVLGFILYLIITTVLVCHLFFRPFETGDWDAPYWICMGAAAIITLTGAEFITYLPDRLPWEGIRETVLWMTVVAWMIGTSWIPYLLVMDIRKFTHAGISAPIPLWIKTFPWSRLAFGREYHAYDPPSWSRVFPMGMYTASLLSLMSVTGYGVLAIISQCWGWFALTVWFLTFIGMLRSVAAVIKTATISSH